MTALTIETRPPAEADSNPFRIRACLRISNLVSEAQEFFAFSADDLRQQCGIVMQILAAPACSQEEAAERLAALDGQRLRLPEFVERWSKTESPARVAFLSREKISNWSIVESKRKLDSRHAGRWHLHVRPSRQAARTAGWHNIAGYPAGYGMLRKIHDWPALWESILLTVENDERLSFFAHGVGI